MEEIISSIQTKIIPELPTMIYIGIGTYAGMLTTINDKKILEDKNYHQFPPCVQKIYSENKTLQLFIILIDPSQENPVYMTTDNELNQKYFNSPWSHYNDGSIEIYENTRITIYPFRQNIKSVVTNYLADDYYDITNCLYILNDMCISNGYTLLYHDFSGSDSPKLLGDYFYKQIENYLDHIIYGIAFGYINACYYDFTSPEAFFASRFDHETNNVKIFNIVQIFNNYIQECELHFLNLDFDSYIGNEIYKYKSEDIEIIQKQIWKIKEQFIYFMKNYIIYILRTLKTLTLKTLKTLSFSEQNIILERVQFCLNAIDDTKEIYNIIINSDNVYDDVKCIISKKYKYKFIAFVDKRYSKLNETEILNIVTSNDDKYKWCDTVIELFGH